MARAYILIHTEPGHAGAVAQEAQRIRGVLVASDVTGPYDVVVEAEGRNLQEIHDQVLAPIQEIDGITRTLTCPVIRL